MESKNLNSLLNACEMTFLRRAWAALVAALLLTALGSRGQELYPTLADLRAGLTRPLTSPADPSAAPCNASERAEAASLHALATSPGSTALLYIIAHDASSMQTALALTRCLRLVSNAAPSPAAPNANTSALSRDWVRVQLIPSTVFFESVAYSLLLESRGSWAHFDYVVTATYKTMSQKGQTVAEMTRLLRVARDGQWDAVPFLRSGSGMMSNCLYWHKKPYKRAWDAVLAALNYTSADIRRHDEMKPFFRNVAVFRADVLARLSAWMARAMEAAARPPLSALLAHDSNYKEGSAETAKRCVPRTCDLPADPL